jgi:phenylacetate-coenzyme A ligase PaaK-like adenylate-forming protein
VFEDSCILEVVDDQDRPVPDGETGARILVTNLWHRTQPIIRYALTDVTQFLPGRCETCGRTFRRLAPIEGRTDDVLHLPARAGGSVPIVPLQFGVITKLPSVRDFEVVQRADGTLRIRVTPRNGTPETALAEQVDRAVRERLDRAGADATRLEVEVCAEIARSAGGKVKLVRREG